MRHFPVFLDTRDRRVVVSGAGEGAAAKIALLLKSEARVVVFGENPCERVLDWAAGDYVDFHPRRVEACDVIGAKLVYGANDDDAEDRRAVALGRKAGALGLVVDNLDASDFITPAIVDRDPVLVAIGTEGTAPVLARQIKARVEAMLPASTGRLARLADGFRGRAATLRSSALRRHFWTRWFFEDGTRDEESLEALLAEVKSDAKRPGHVHLVGAGPGDPDLLTRKAAKLLHDADVVIHDRLVSGEILELARREAIMVDVGKKGFGTSTPQGRIDAAMIEHARAGRQVVRLKAGDPGIFGRLDEETAALDAADVAWSLVPGITAAAAAAADIGVSLTRRGRNSSLTVLTGHDTQGFAEHDWKRLAREGETAAIYMGLRAARFVQGRLLMFGRDPATPVTIVFDASRDTRETVPATLATMSDAIADARSDGPAVILLGLAPHRVAAALPDLAEASVGGVRA